MLTIVDWQHIENAKSSAQLAKTNESPSMDLKNESKSDIRIAKIQLNIEM